MFLSEYSGVGVGCWRAIHGIDLSRNAVLNVLMSFAALAIVVVVGYLIRRTKLVDDAGQRTLARVVFYVCTPALLAENLSQADLAHALSKPLLVAAVSSTAAMLLVLCVARLVWHRPWPDVFIGMMSTAYTNSTYLGIPISVYVLGSAEFVAPLLLFQLLVFNPVITTLLSVSTRSDGSFVRRITHGVIANPILIGALVGIALNLANLTLPNVLGQPLSLIGDVAVPGALLVFGMSFFGVRPMRQAGRRRDVMLASFGSLIVMPLVAYILGGPVLGLTGLQLLSVVIVAALPTGQNVYLTAVAFNHGQVIARDTILITSVGAVAVMVAVAGLLAG